MRIILKNIRLGLLWGLITLPTLIYSQSRPNILLAISDDQSFAHTSKAGFAVVKTPAFDRVASEGIYFTQAFAGSPGCSPSRAALLTGRHCWQLEHAGTHASQFSPKYVSYPELLAKAGYHVGYTGKPWGPGSIEASGRTENPAGPVYEGKFVDSPAGISRKDYSGNFADFMSAKKDDQPFCFWFGGHEPHRKFKKGIGLEQGKSLEDVIVPGFLPDDPEIRSDLLDYAVEIEWFDQHLGKMIALLEERGELENTLIIVSSDNGMAFPRAKANVYEYGIHVPMAMRWGNKVVGNRTVEDLVSFIDIAPTVLEVAGVEHPGEYPMRGKSLVSILESKEGGIVDRKRQAVFSSRERHSSSRYNSLSYPQRCIRTQDYLYIYNIKPERWPAGSPQKYGMGNYANKEEYEKQVLGPAHGGYHDIDACPSLDFLLANRTNPKVKPYFELAVYKRSGEEMYDIKKDPYCLNNLAYDEKYQDIAMELRKQLRKEMRETGDARLGANGDIWESYPRYSRLRTFPEPDWAKRDPAKVPDMDWLEERLRKQYE